MGMEMVVLAMAIVTEAMVIECRGWLFWRIRRKLMGTLLIIISGGTVFFFMSLNI